MKKTNNKTNKLPAVEKIIAVVPEYDGKTLKRLITVSPSMDSKEQLIWEENFYWDVCNDALDDIICLGMYIHKKVTWQGCTILYYNEVNDDSPIKRTFSLEKSLKITLLTSWPEINLYDILKNRFVYSRGRSIEEVIQERLRKTNDPVELKPKWIAAGMISLYSMYYRTDDTRLN